MSSKRKTRLAIRPIRHWCRAPLGHSPAPCLIGAVSPEIRPYHGPLLPVLEVSLEQYDVWMLGHCAKMSIAIR